MTMALETALGFDAAWPPNPAPNDYGGRPITWCEVYIGGSSAAHVWTAPELALVTHLAKLPVWVPTPGVDNPGQSARACLNALRSFGVPGFADPWRAVLIDLETGASSPPNADPAWLATFRSRIEAGGYDTMVYASMSVVCAYPAYTGRLGACWDGSPGFTCNGEALACSIVGKQYAAEVRVPGGFVDLDVLDSSILPHLWPPTA